jgi:hypothetical protein
MTSKTELAALLCWLLGASWASWDTIWTDPMGFPSGRVTGRVGHGLKTNPWQGHEQHFVPICYSGMGLGKNDLMKPDPIVGLKRYGSRQPYNNKKKKKEKNTLQ